MAVKSCLKLQMCIKLNPGQYEWLMQRKDRTGQAASEFIRRLIDVYRRQEQLKKEQEKVNDGQE